MINGSLGLDVLVSVLMGASKPHFFYSVGPYTLRCRSVKLGQWLGLTVRWRGREYG